MILKKIKQSNFFLTAKGKYVDTYELHALAVGLAVASMYYLPIPPKIVQIAHIVVLSTSLGIELIKDKGNKKTIEQKAMDMIFTNKLRRQIAKEGQYSIIGLVIPHIVMNIDKVQAFF